MFKWLTATSFLLIFCSRKMIDRAQQSVLIGHTEVAEPLTKSFPIPVTLMLSTWEPYPITFLGNVEVGGQRGLSLSKRNLQVTCTKDRKPLSFTWALLTRADFWCLTFVSGTQRVSQGLMQTHLPNSALPTLLRPPQTFHGVIIPWNSPNTHIVLFQ